MRDTSGMPSVEARPSGVAPETLAVPPAGNGDGRGDLQLLARGGSLNLIGGVVRAVLGFALVIVVTRGLHSQGSGLLFEAIALFTILTNTAELGADTGLVRQVSRYSALGLVTDLRPMLLVSIGPVVAIGVAFGAAVFAFAPQLADLLIHGANRARGVQYLRILAPFLPVASCTAVVLAATRGFGTMVPSVLLESIAKPVVRPILTALAILIGATGGTIALAWGVPEAVELPVAIFALVALLRRAERARAATPERRSARVLASEFWRFSAPRGMAALFQITVIWLDVLLVGALRSAKEAGIYAAASRLVAVGWFAIEAVRLAIGPQLSALLARGDRDRANRLYQVGTWWLMVPSWPVYVALAIFAPFVLKLFGPEFAAGHTALVILSLSMLLALGTGNVTVVLLMGGKSTWNLVNTIVSLIINVTLNLLLIPKYGMSGAAIAWTASLAWDNIMPLIQVALFLKLHPFGKGYARVASAAILCYGTAGLAARYVFGLNLLSFAVFGVVATSVYSVIIWRSRHLLELPVFGQAIRARWQRSPSAPPAPNPSPEPVATSGRPEQRSPLNRVPEPVRSSGKALLRWYGVATSPLRGLPDFMIIGAKRGGTTSLYNYLVAHPRIAPLFPPAAKIKGIHYFDSNAERGLGWYRSHFPTRVHEELFERRNGTRRVMGEASPYYLFHPLAAERASRVVPGSKIIVLLRNPVDRAYSHYLERVRNGVEKLSFEEAIDREAERMAGEEQRIISEHGYSSFAHEHLSYVAQGEYLEPLRRWLERFPREQFLIMPSDDLSHDPLEGYRRVLGFLGVPDFDPGAFPRYNFHRAQPMAPSTRERLREHFAPHNARLAELLQMDLSCWDG
jgi:O-antigen/teichoic acid export membrane protein